MKFNLKTFVTNAGLTLGAALVFALSFPNFIYKWGFWPLAFVALVPLGILVRRISFKTSFIYGLFYGLFSYALFNFWLAKFHPLAIIIVPTIYAGYLFLVIPLLKLADMFFPKWGFLLQTVLWVGYEYLSTLGFVGYSYGVIGYAFYSVPQIAGIASLGGVWIVSFLPAFSGFLGAAFVNRFIENKKVEKDYVPSAVIWIAAVIGALIFSIATFYDYSGDETRRLALVQHNMDPWVGGDTAYKEGLHRLTRLSEKALREDADIDMVVWSETAFVPGIEWHKKYQTNRTRLQLVRKLDNFLEKQDIPFVFGNGYGVGPGEKRVNYNAVYLYDNQDYIERYEKVHLVPFTEHFPYKDTLPAIHDWLKNADTHFWEKGDEYTVMDAAGMKFSTPICFEDTFGYLSREFINNGAQVIVNLTNDTWSKSEVSMIQHYGMAVFRAIENKRSVVRSSNGGFTSVIDPNGFLLASVPVFEETYLIHDVPLASADTTLYRLWGDWFGIALSILATAGLVAGFVVWRIRKD